MFTCVSTYEIILFYVLGCESSESSPLNLRSTDSYPFAFVPQNLVIGTVVLFWNIVDTEASRTDSRETLFIIRETAAFTCLAIC